MIDHFRRVGRLRPIDDLADSLVADEFEASSIARLDINDLLEQLPPKQARMIRAIRLEGLSVAEAASAEGIGESDVKVSVHRGLKALMARVHGAVR
jgi:RNA polymerase sigma-70 factor (ECF subfamily)